MMQTKLQYFNCINPTHKQQPLGRLCIEPGCSSNALLCYFCEKQKHSGHKILCLQEFFENLAEIRFGPGLEAPVKDLTEIIKTSKAECLQKIQNTRKIFIQEFDKLAPLVEKKFDFFLENVEQQAKRVCENLRETNKYNIQISFQEILVNLDRQIKWFLQYDKAYSEIPRRSQKIKKICNAYLDNIRTPLDSITQLAQSFAKVVQIPIVMNLIPQSRQKPLNSLSWDSQLKNADIRCIGGRAELTRNDEENNRLGAGVLGNIQLNESNKIYRWSIKVEQNQKIQCIGICLESAAKKKRFLRLDDDWQQLGHGHYVMTGNGAVFSHSDSQINKKHITCQFADYDIIHFEYDTGHNVLSIWKNDFQNFWSFQVESAPSNDFYRPCGYIGGAGDALQITQQGL